MSADNAAAGSRAFRALPGLEAENRPFWTGGRNGELLITRCRDCQRYQHPPLPRCPACGGRDLDPTAVSGEGRVATFTVNHQVWAPGLQTPYVFAAIELAEQPELYVFTNIVGCAPDEVRHGLAVEVVFEAHEDVYLPFFQPKEPCA